MSEQVLFGQPVTTLEIPWTKLAMSFDPAGLRADLALIPEIIWLLHFNQQDYDGNWSSVALKSRSGRANDIVPIGGPEDFRDTPLMEACPHLHAVVEAFQCPMKSVRLLRLAAGSRIKEHRDRDLVLKDGELRIHVPVMTNEKLEFVVANRRLILREGEAWYIDFTQPHRIYNGGETDRTHLILDACLNDWAIELLERSVKDVVTETFDPVS